MPPKKDSLLNQFLPESNIGTAAQVLILLHLDGVNTLLHGLTDFTLALLKGILHAAAHLI